MKLLARQSGLAIALFLSATRCTEPKEAGQPKPHGTSTRTPKPGHATLQVLQRGLGPRKPMVAPRPLAAYGFRYQITEQRGARKSRVSIQGTMEQERDPAGMARPFVVTRLDKVRPASLSRLLLKRIVGRPLSSLSPTSSTTLLGPHLQPPLPQVPIGPGARWKLVGWLTESNHSPRIQVQAEYRMEGGQGAMLIRETLVLSCPKNAEIPCSGKGQAQWDIRTGLTTSVHSTVRLEMGEGPNKIVQTQNFEARAPKGRTSS